MSDTMQGTYEVTLGDSTSLVTVTRRGTEDDGRVRYQLQVGDAEPFEVETTRPQADVLSILVGTRTYECGVDLTDEGVDVDVLGIIHEATLVDPRRKALRMAGSAGGAVVKTAMPGRIVRILVAPGDAVTKGQPLLVVEAMKMENEIKAPRDGVLKRVAVEEGQLVEAKAVLVELE